MTRRNRLLVSVLALLLIAVAMPGDSIGGPRQILIEARISESVRYDDLRELGLDWGFLEYDTSGGMRFKTDKKFKVDGEKHRGVRMKAKQDNAFGFFTLGREFSVDAGIFIEATLQFMRVKGLTQSSTIAMELDSPYVPVGGQFDNFLVVGASYENGGLRAFTNLNGTNQDGSVLFPDTMTLSFQVHVSPDDKVTVDVKPPSARDWTNLTTDLGFQLEDSLGIGMGMFNVNNGANGTAGDIKIKGDGLSLWVDPVIRPILVDMDDLRVALADAHGAMIREDQHGEPDPDILTAETQLKVANDLRIRIRQDIEVAWDTGQLHEDTSIGSIYRNLDKAENKLDSVLGRIPLVGHLFKSRDTRRVRKAETLIFVSAHLLSIGEED